MKYLGTIAYRSNFGAQVFEGFVWSCVNAWDFLKREHQGNFHFMRGLSCLLDESANEIAGTFLGDWVLMLDTDHMFSADVFLEMIQVFEENTLDILVGFTQKRQPPYHPVIYKTDFDPFKNFETIFPDVLQKHRLLLVDSSGAACLMVRRTVFEAIAYSGERPFDRRRKFNNFHLKNRSRLNYVGPASGNPKEAIGVSLPEGRHIDETFGEDTSFFWRAKMLGFQAWCAPWIRFHHIETRLVTETMIMEDELRAIPK